MKIAELIKQVATEETSSLIVEILSSGAGHSAFLCDQAEWDRMMKDYHHCVAQVQHHLQCGGHGGVCQWVQAFVNSCTGRVMGQCWTEEARLLLKRRQTEMLYRSQVIVEENCDQFSQNTILFVLSYQQNQQNLQARKHLTKVRSLIGSQWLRLG